MFDVKTRGSHRRKEQKLDFQETDLLSLLQIWHRCRLYGVVVYTF